MNIFFLDVCPFKSARYYFNKHCIKIILEITQMLYAAHWMSDSNENWEATHQSDLNLPAYRKTHVNHPTTKWVRRSIDNYNYTVTMGFELCYEYTRRFGKVHKCQVRLEWLRDHVPLCTSDTMTHHTATRNVPEGCTPIPLAMPEKYYSDDAVQSYRQYYLAEKSEMVTPRDELNSTLLAQLWNLSNVVRVKD